MDDYEREREYYREEEIKRQIAEKLGTHPDDVYQCSTFFGEHYATKSGATASVEGDKIYIDKPAEKRSSTGSYSSSPSTDSYSSSSIDSGSNYGSYSSDRNQYRAFSRALNRVYFKRKYSGAIAVILAIAGIVCLLSGDSGAATIGVFLLIYPAGKLLWLILKGIVKLIGGFFKLLFKALPFLIGLGILGLIIYYVSVG